MPSRGGTWEAKVWFIRSGQRETSFASGGGGKVGGGRVPVPEDFSMRAWT